MRTDIKYNIDGGDITLTSINSDTISNAQIIDEDDNSLYIEIGIAKDIAYEELFESCICFSLSYTPIYKYIQIRVRKNINGNDSLLLNPVNNSTYFPLLYKTKPIRASELQIINKNNIYGLVLQKNGYADVYSGETTDLLKVNAENQNTNSLLSCTPGNNYRYPMTGVGFVKYLHSNIKNTDLTAVLQREFEEDGVIITNAEYDFDTEKLKIEAQTTND